MQNLELTEAEADWLINILASKLPVDYLNENTSISIEPLVDREYRLGILNKLRKGPSNA